MPDYDVFAPFYDRAMDDPTDRGDRVLASIRRFFPDARSVLELGCGTGAILAQLDAVPSLTGLDRSAEMLAVASQTVPRARLVQGSMDAFSLGRRFDVVVCVFDSLNHLLTFEAWQSTFDAVYDHLVAGGLFIFDVNTVGELRRLGEEPPWVYEFGEHDLMIMDVCWTGGGRSEWDIRIFEHLGGARYELHHERIGELAVELSRIRAVLEPRFELLSQSGDTDDPPSDQSVKGYFTYRRRP